jgi:hypothetical protein
MKYLQIVTILAVIFLIHCSTPVSKTSESIITIKELHRSIDLKPTKDNNIFIEDLDFPGISVQNERIFVSGPSLESKNDYNIYIYDRELNLLGEKKFSIGQGPGEMGGAPYLWPVGDRIYVPDNTQQRINIFDKNLNFIEFVKTTFSTMSPIFSENGKYFIFVTGNNGKYGPVSSFSVYLSGFPGLKRKLIHQFPEVDYFIEEKRELIYGIRGIHYFLKDDRIYLLDKDNYHLIIRDSNGKMVKQVQMDYEKIRTTDKMKEMWLKDPVLKSRDLMRKFKVKLAEYVQPCAFMVPLEKGFVVTRKKDYNTSCQGLVEGDYFDYNLNLLGKVEFPCFSEIFWLRTYIFLNACVFDRGFLYLVNRVERENDEVISLEKWKISE